jgi:hypothetical protein
MPTRTRTSNPKRPAPGRFGRTASPRRPNMMTRRQPQKSGTAKVAEKLGRVLPSLRAQSGKRGAAGGRGKKRTTGGLALLAGAAGFAMKNREALMSKIRRRRDSSTGA